MCCGAKSEDGVFLSAIFGCLGRSARQVAASGGSATGDVAGMFFICQQVSERKELLPAEEPEMRQELPGSPSCPELGERQVLFNNPL